MDWLTTTARALVDGGDRGRGPVPCAQALGEGQSGHGGVDQPASGLDRAVASHDERSVHLGDLLDRLADTRIADVSLFPAIALERVEPEWAGPGQDVSHIADDDQRAHRLAFASLAADLDGRIDHSLERLERNPGLQAPQVAGSQPLEVLAQPDHGQASRAASASNPE